MQIHVKDKSVNIWGLQVEMQPVLKQAGIIWRENRFTMVVTSARDGIHSEGSLHYYGYAVDLRTYYFSDAQKIQVHDKLRNVLGGNYRVLLEKTHMHVEYRKALEL